MRDRRGYVLMEAVVTCLILSFSIVALMPVFSLSAKGSLRTEQALVAGHLAAELLEEIKLRRWEEGAAAGALGPDASEDARDKRTFNDIDDFDGWSESPPLDPVMRPAAGFPGYARAVTVRYAAEDGSPSAERTALKSVSVCVRVKDATRACLERLFARR